MSRSERIVILAVVAVATWLTASACSLAEGACLRMSDCADGLSCVEGSCLPNGSAAAISSPDATSDDATSPASSDASAE